jgi:hypothetical protein
MVTIVKLKNNVEVIGTVKETTENHIMIEDPFSINYMFSPRSERPVVGLLRYMPFAEERILAFPKAFIINTVLARRAMANYYSVILSTHQKEIDETVDMELDRITYTEDAPQENTAEILAAMIDRLKTNNNMH